MVPAKQRKHTSIVLETAAASFNQKREKPSPCFSRSPANVANGSLILRRFGTIIMRRKQLPGRPASLRGDHHQTDVCPTQLRQKAADLHPRSEERRVGKECRSRWSP